MSKQAISIIVGLVLVVGTGSLVYFTKKPIVVPPENVTNIVQNVSTTTIKNTPVKVTKLNDDDDDDDNGGTTPAPVTTPTPTPTPTPSGISLTQIAQHGSRSSCWSAINGGVYDLTSWIPNHPGGEQAIMSLCGIDGSNGYNGQHGGSSKTARILGGFKIGTLAK